MTLNPTGYYRPQTIKEAVRLLSQPHIATALLSGGALRLASTGDVTCEAVIDLQDIAELQRIDVADDGTLHLGASATLEAVVRHAHTPLLLKRVIRRTLTWNRRNAITLGEAIEHPAEVAELIAALLALDATAVFAMPEEQRIPLAEIDMVTEQPRVPRKGLVTVVELPAPQTGRVWEEAHVARTPADEAIVSVAAVLVIGDGGLVEQARLACTGLWLEPARLAVGASQALIGHPLDKAPIEAALAALDQEIVPVADYRGGIDYRRAMARVLACRALELCKHETTKKPG